ncbi:transposase [Singulisphaera sp. GP187]|uniref:IS110 family transposase n=1 Tax=Singulisphaera sp. GP187 TaxID=1882752 RepID=UPI0009419B43
MASSDSGGRTKWSVFQAIRRHKTGYFERLLVRRIVERRSGLSLTSAERFHLPVQTAFQTAGFEVRIVHPFATKQFRQPADPGNKTDDTDFSAIHRAVVNGFGLLEHEPDPHFSHLQLLARHRRDLVSKNGRRKGARSEWHEDKDFVQYFFRLLYTVSRRKPVYARS